jgi:hypothetical protein
MVEMLQRADKQCIEMHEEILYSDINLSDIIKLQI